MFQVGPVEVDKAMLNDLYTKMTSSHEKYSYATMMIKDKKVVIDELGAAQATFDPAENEKLFNEMKARTASKTRFIFFNFQILRPSGHKTQDIAYIFWMDAGKVRIFEKPLYASTNNVVEKAITAFTDHDLSVPYFRCPDAFPFDYSALQAEMIKLALKGAL
ncbi:hypothetical protein OS493_000052 [Desmophyllum pertusum]|uniref:ADF-H domain-containing protein n=1 Tax=Desmophyllum pertusum TaxID=174260 RepID=A0A9X0A774_9CNID|nr:hypothetical protein OS493_000052 [Desmophyllum pertusum]